MNATQARDLALAAAPTKEQAEYDNVQIKIRDQAADGRFNHIYDLAISKAVRDRLESEGFRVQPGQFSGTLVSWEPDQGIPYEHNGKYYIGLREVLYPEFEEAKRMHRDSITK